MTIQRNRSVFNSILSLVLGIEGGERMVGDENKGDKTAPRPQQSGVRDLLGGTIWSGSYGYGG
jgi:hypothetical protein